MFLFKRREASHTSHPFTDEQIQAKFYELWKARGYVGSSVEEDRQKAIALLKAENSLPVRAKALDSSSSRHDREFALKVKQFYWERFRTVISAVGLTTAILAGVGLYLSDRNTQEKRLITERFSKAIEQLGSKDVAVRIGGIYALERIAKDSPEDHWTVIEVLNAYVRERSPLPKEADFKNGKETNQSAEIAKPSTDIQSALTAIGRRDTSRDAQGRFLNFSDSNLSGAVLNDAALTGANLNRAYIKNTDLTGANLDRAYFQNANLTGADLRGSNLNRAYLKQADLRGTNLGGVNLNRAYLKNVNLAGADLKGANLNRTYLKQAENLTDRQLDLAKLCKTQLPNGSKLNPDRDCKEIGIEP